MSLDNVRAGVRITGPEAFVVARRAADRYRFITTPEYGQTIGCADHMSTHFEHHHIGPLRDFTGAMLWIGQHELEHHADDAVVVESIQWCPIHNQPFPHRRDVTGVPCSANPVRADDTAVIPLVASVGNRPAIGSASYTAGSIPPGRDWTSLAGVGLDVRHMAAGPVRVGRAEHSDGSRVFTLPADGFPGATWEIRASAPYVVPAPAPATGPAPYRAEDHAADVCGRCGGDVRKDQARAVLPPPLGSLSAAHPLTLCGKCYATLCEIVSNFAGEVFVPGCENCGASVQRCNANGCGQRQAPGWRTALRLQSGNGMEVRG